MKKIKKQTGFTIVELLIVIVVIAILATITIVSYNGVQDNARAANIVDGIKHVEEGFKLLSAEQQSTTWWNDNSFTGADNPSLDEVINNSNLKKYVPATPAIPGMSPVWTYDNDGDVRDPAACDVTWSGVILTLYQVPTSVIAKIDKTIDDGNLTCGNVRGNGTRLIYNLSFDQTMK